MLAGGVLSVLSDHISPSDLEPLDRWLAMPLTMERQCTYEQGGDKASYSFSGSFDGTTVPSGESRTLTIGGLSYDAWLTTKSQAIWFVISRRP